jgi:para-nitrobenzyl esterase
MAVTSQETVTVQTSRGAVRGTVEGGIARFLGVPFAAPPFAENRFELPRAHEPWAGELDATRFGPTPPQAPYQGIHASLLPTVAIEGDEILNANIWAPVGAMGGTRLPVMVWIYGGALIRGSNAWPTYVGAPFARDGVVYVALNYRVGVEGFGQLDGAPDNRGLADVVAGLEWVRDEIDAFGGDPGDVTVFGQSAGGVLVSTLLGTPPARGLFSKAIVMSAGLGPAPRRPERTLATAIAEDLRIPATKQAFAARTPAELVDAQTRALSGGTIGTSALFPTVVAGDQLLPEPLWSALEAGAADDVRVVIGTTAAEGRFWYAPAVAPPGLTREVVESAVRAFGLSPTALAVYERNRPGQDAAAIYGALVLDLICRVGLNSFADRRSVRGAPTWVYEFAWPSPVLDLGPAHCVDLPFFFDNLEDEWSRALAGDRAPQPLADEMHTALVRFARTGDPGWDAWTAARPVMTFDDPVSQIVNAPREDERLALLERST